MGTVNAHLCIHGLNCAVEFKNIISNILSFFLITLNLIIRTYLYIALFISFLAKDLDNYFYNNYIYEIHHGNIIFFQTENK